MHDTSDPNPKSGYVSFPIPKGFVPPEHEGDSFDAVCRFKVEGEELCMVKLGEHDMPEKEHKSDEPNYKGMAKEIVGGMGPSTMESSY